MKVENPTTAGISTEVKGAAPLVPVGDEPDPVVDPVPVALLCTFVLPEAQKNAPLMILVLASCWKGSQLMFPELCILKVPLQSERAGKATLLSISMVSNIKRSHFWRTLRNFQTC